jgi:hypothetical protein
VARSFPFQLQEHPVLATLVQRPSPAIQPQEASTASRAAADVAAAPQGDARVAAKHTVQLHTNSASSQALGSVTAELHGSRLLAVATCRASNERGFLAGSPLRATIASAPTYSERAAMPYRNPFLRKDLTNEREQYVEGLMESVLQGVLPANLPVDINAHGSLLQCASLNTARGGPAGFDPKALPDAPLLYANALSLALAMCNIVEAPFAAARVVRQHTSRKLIVNPMPTELLTASAQLLYIGTRRGPLTVMYDTARPQSGGPRQHIPPAELVDEMLDTAHASALEALGVQEEALARMDLSERKWPHLTPSPGTIRVLQDLAGDEIDTFLRSGPCSRAEQVLGISALEVSNLHILGAG